MIIDGARKIIPIGCSCITKFQIDFAFEGTQATSRSGLLDWNIAIPAATVALLERHASGRLINDFTRRDAFGRHPKGGHLVNLTLPGLHFWHEDAEAILDDASSVAFDRFCAKMRHVIPQTFADHDEVHLIWSNIQPNLKASALGKTSDRWPAFRLTTERHEQIVAAADLAYSSPRVHFVTRREDCDAVLWGVPNVWIMELDRGWGFRGPKGLYAPLFDHILRGDVSSAAIHASRRHQMGDNHATRSARG